MEQRPARKAAKKSGASNVAGKKLAHLAALFSFNAAQEHETLRAVGRSSGKVQEAFALAMQ